MKYAIAIMLCMILFAILEPSYTIDCYVCKWSDEGCGLRDGKVPEKYKKTCDANVHQCATYTKFNATTNVLDRNERVCLADDKTKYCGDIRYCTPCATQGCNNM